MRVEGETFPKTLLDPAGERIRLERPPQRIVSATLVADEMLTEMIAPERLVAVTAYAEQPGVSNCREKLPPHAARLQQAYTEEILALRPDLVFVADYSEANTVRQLLGAGIPVVRLGQERGFEAIARNLALLGAVTGEEARAADMAASMRARIEAVKRRVAGRPRPRVLYYTQWGTTAGVGTLIDEMIELGGGRNVARELGLKSVTQVQLEAVLAARPEVLIVQGYLESGEAAVRRLLDDPLWAGVPAVRDRRIHAVPAKSMGCVSQYGVEGLEAVARALHPEAFEE
ncbi:MAG: ABC transporter substrate-binding protein [Planctomycetota bacterium]|nr:ABC transporter substrate-binding protein [Planctomycetota bacterium]